MLHLPESDFIAYIIWKALPFIKRVLTTTMPLRVDPAAKPVYPQSLGRGRSSMVDVELSDRGSHGAGSLIITQCSGFPPAGPAQNGIVNLLSSFSA